MCLDKTHTAEVHMSSEKRIRRLEIRNQFGSDSNKDMQHIPFSIKGNVSRDNYKSATAIKQWSYAGSNPALRKRMAKTLT